MLTLFRPLRAHSWLLRPNRQLFGKRVTPLYAVDRSMRIAVEGCGHGALDEIYASVDKSCRTKGWDGVDLLIIGGDFQVGVIPLSLCVWSTFKPGISYLYTIFQRNLSVKPAVFPTLFRSNPPSLLGSPQRR